MNALDVLRQDHQRILGMLTDLEEGRSVLSGATEAELEARRDLVTRLVIAESIHEAVEEQHFWPVVRDVLSDFPDLASRGLQQETVAKVALHEVDTVGPRHPEFEAMLARFVEGAREHISYEEVEVWPALVSVVGPAELEAMGDRLTDARRTAPTRPHPHVPTGTMSLRTVGAGWAMLDRLRDKATGRTG
ncbi:MAG: hemerythrin domain-containing protein [Actinocatenispora sp.]